MLQNKRQNKSNRDRTNHHKKSNTKDQTYVEKEVPQPKDYEEIEY